MGVLKAAEIDIEHPWRCVHPGCGVGVLAYARTEPFFVSAEGVRCREHGARVSEEYVDALREYRALVARRRREGLAILKQGPEAHPPLLANYILARVRLESQDLDGDERELVRREAHRLGEHLTEQELEMVGDLLNRLERPPSITVHLRRIGEQSLEIDDAVELDQELPLSTGS